MNLGSILNADMTTMRLAAARGWHWWVGQLQELVPDRLRTRRQSSRQLAMWDGGRLTIFTKSGKQGQMPVAGARIALAVPSRCAFDRTLKLPRMNRTDLRRLVELESDRLSPLPSGETLVGIDMNGDAASDGHVEVAVAVLPSNVAEQAIRAAGEAGLVVTGFGLVAQAGEPARFDFMPALRERQLVGAEGSGRVIWWSLVAFAFALNLAVLVVRDQQSVAQLAAIAEGQAPAVKAARAIQQRANDFDVSTRELAARRRSHDVLGALATVSQALPDGAWVQRFTFTGQAARLTGYKRKDADVLAALRGDPRIAGIRSNSAQLVADTPAGQPFDLTIQLRGGR